MTSRTYLKQHQEEIYTIKKTEARQRQDSGPSLGRPVAELYIRRGPLLTTHIGPLCKTCRADDGPLLGLLAGNMNLKIGSHVNYRVFLKMHIKIYYDLCYDTEWLE